MKQPCSSIFRICLIFAYLQTGFASPSAAQAEFHTMERFGKEQGISAAPICLAEDKHGFIWIGTRGGLLRFDGAAALEAEAFAMAELADNTVNYLTYDEQTNQLWAGTGDGLIKYHLSSGKVEKLSALDFFPKEKIVRAKSEFAGKDRQGDWWADFQVGGVVRFPADGGPPQQYQVEQLPGSAYNQAQLTYANTVIYVLQDRFQDSILWGGTRYGLMRINKAEGKARQVLFFHPDPKVTTASNPMLHLYQHTNGLLYISTWNGGMLEFDPATELFQQFLLSSKGIEAANLNNQVRKIFPRNERELWVTKAGEEKALFAFDIQARKLSLVRNSCGIDYIDRGGNIWNIAPNSLELYHRQRNDLERYYFPADGRLPTSRILAVKALGNGSKLLVLHKGQRSLSELDRHTGRWRAITVAGPAATAMRGAFLEETTAGILTNDQEKLYFMAAGSPRFEELPLRLPADANWFVSAVGADGSVFISGIKGYFIWLKPGFKEMAVYAAKDVGEPFPGYFSEVKVCPPDKFGRPWMSTSSGYSIFDPQQGRFSHFPYRQLPERSFSEYRGLCPDQRGRVWCYGPHTLGWIDQERPEQGIQQRFDLSTGYAVKDIWQVQCDGQGRVWFVAEQEALLMDFDPRHLQQILSNLLSNALKFSPEYGAILVLAKRDGQTFELRVEDTGPGIPEGQEEKIFERFYQAEAHARSSSQGTGIGLALAKELTQLMGGSIAAKNKAGEGSLFTVRLPITRQAPQSGWGQELAAPKLPEAELSEASLPQDFFEELPILLIIEDSADLIRYLSALLRNRYCLLIARNGREGVDKAIEFLPDIILSDVMMPEMSGLEVCDALKNDARTSHIPIILLTAKAGADDRLDALRRGAAAYLEKPFNQEELFVQLANALELRRRVAQHILNPHADAASKDPALQAEQAFLQQVRAAVAAGFSDDDFDVLRLCRALSMSRAQLYRKLSALTGMSAALFIRKVRLEKAKELLLSSDSSIAEIAYSVGFKDPNYFSRIFSETYGMPPSEMRK